MSVEFVITGASGFLGGHLLSRCRRNRVVGTYHADASQADGKWLQVDFSRPQAAAEKIAALRPQVVIHAAARANLDWCERHPEEAMRINAEAAIALAARCADIGSRFVFISTDMVFDGNRGGYREDDDPSPINHYGRTKLAAEQGALRENPGSLIVRTALIYGFPRNAQRTGPFLPWLVARLRQGEPAPLFVDQYRTPVEVGEAAQAILDLAATDATGVVHVAGSERLDRCTFGRYVCEIFGFDPALLEPVSMNEVPSVAPRPRDLSLNTDRLQRLLGRSLSTCREGLTRVAAESA